MPPARRIAAVGSTVPVGATFLDWSILWLSGQDLIYSVRDSEWLPICQNPIDDGTNAHGHRKNHPRGFDNCQSTVKLLKSVTIEDVTSLYFCPMGVADAMSQLAISKLNLQDAANWKQIVDCQIEDFQNSATWLASEDIPCIYLSFDPTIPLYQPHVKQIPRHIITDERVSLMEQQFHVRKIFYPKSLEQWPYHTSLNIWDKREMLALTMQPFVRYDLWEPELEANHLWLNCQDWWFDSESVITEVMDYCQLHIDQHRLVHWKQILPKWQHIQNSRLKMSRHISHIVKCIVLGRNIRLPDLDLLDEALIQHCLIFQHDLNLRTWGLEKFPANSIELTERLEANHHQTRSTA